MAVLTSTYNQCFQQEYEKYQNFLSENFPFLVVKFSIYLNRRVFVMNILFVSYLGLPRYLRDDFPYSSPLLASSAFVSFLVLSVFLGFLIVHVSDS